MLAWDQLRPVVLDRIGSGEVTASELRERLAVSGVSMSPLVFRGMLAALEGTGLVSGRYGDRLGGEIAAEDRCYRLTSAGSSEMRSARKAGRREAA